MRAEAVFVLAAALCLGMACEREAPRDLECGSPDHVKELAGVHYQDADCEAAIQSAETRLSAAFYRKACQQLAPSAGLPERVSDAHVTSCIPAIGDAGGSILQIQLCCE